MVISKSDMLDGILKPQRAEAAENGRKPRRKSPKRMGRILRAVCWKNTGKRNSCLLHGGHRTAVRDHLCHPQLYQRGCDGAGSERQDHCGGGSILTRDKLGYTLTEEYDPKATPGVIIKQNPAAHSRVKAGRKIHLVVSKGPEPGVVPDLKKKTLAEATTMLEKARLKVGNVTVKYEAGAPKGSVLSQSIAPKQKVSEGTSVDLVVNISGNQTVVPDLSGLSLAEARNQLSSGGTDHRQHPAQEATRPRIRYCPVIRAAGP